MTNEYWAGISCLEVRRLFDIAPGNQCHGQSLQVNYPRVTLCYATLNDDTGLEGLNRGAVPTDCIGFERQNPAYSLALMDRIVHKNDTYTKLPHGVLVRLGRLNLGISFFLW